MSRYTISGGGQTVKDQLQLVEIAAKQKLTERQQFVLDEVKRAGERGLHTDEVGALLHARQLKHSHEERCTWCGQDGAWALTELHKKRLVTRVHGSAVAVQERDEPGVLIQPSDSQTDDIPF